MTRDTPSFDHIDHRLHDQLVALVLEHGPQHLEWLTRRARRELRDARIDEQAVIDAIMPSTVLVPRPTGEIDHALALLEGQVLTHRVRAPLRGRTDLWLGMGVQPLLNLATFGRYSWLTGRVRYAARRPATTHSLALPAGCPP